MSSAIGMVSFYNPDDHTIMTGELSDYLQRLVEACESRRGKLFLVRYNKLGSFVIAEWLGKPRDVFVDVMNLGQSLRNFDRTGAAELRHRLFSPITGTEACNHSAEVESVFHHEMQDWNEEEKERMVKVKRGE